MRINGSELGSRMGTEVRKRRSGARKTASPKGPAAAPRPPSRGRRPGARSRAVPAAGEGPEVSIRPARPGDLAAVTAIDARVTGLAKPAYWRGIFRRYGGGTKADGEMSNSISVSARQFDSTASRP